MPRMRANTAAEIAAWTAGLRLETIPQAVRECAIDHLLDGFAVMIAGADQPASRRIDTHLQSLGGRPEATIVFSTRKLPAQQAALANGVRGHVLDYDDAQLSTLRTRPFGQLTHPTVPVLAAAAALAEKIGASGRALLNAYIAGVEVACRLGDAIEPRHYLDGFHPTGTIGAFGAAAACARLLNLDRQGIAAALGIAGSLAAGVRAQRGTMAKSLNAGRAAENGVLAATLAQGGFTASGNIFDDPMGYFSAACYGHARQELIRLGHPFFFAEPGIAIKYYPCAGVLHPALDALIELAHTHDIRPEQIRSVRVRMGEKAARPLVYDRPRSGLEGKFSLPFSAALALVYRRATLADYADPRTQDSRLRKLMERIALVPVPETKFAGRRTEVEIIMDGGASYHGSAPFAKGDPRKPLSRAELCEKFYRCAGRWPRARADAFIAKLSKIEHLPSIRTLLRPLGRRGR